MARLERSVSGRQKGLVRGRDPCADIAWWPGLIEPNRRSDHISAFWDFPALAIELAGLKSVEEMDGISFLPARGMMFADAYAGARWLRNASI